MNYYVELVDKNTHQIIIGTKNNITSNFDLMLNALPCKSPKTWIGYSAKEIIEKIRDAINTLTASPEILNKYKINNNSDEINTLQQILNKVIKSWMPYLENGQVNGNKENTNSVLDPSKTGLTNLLLTEFDSEEIIDSDHRKYIRITTPAINYICDGIILYYDPEKEEISDDGELEQEMTMYANSDKEIKEIHNYIEKVSNRYGCEVRNNELICKTNRICKINLPIKSVTFNAIIPMIQCETEIYTVVKNKLY